MSWQSFQSQNNLRGICMGDKDDRYYPVNAIRICIDECNGDIKGRIYSKMCETPLTFMNCSEMFLRADKLFDDCGYPQSYQEKRDFQKLKKKGHYSRPQIYLKDEEIRSYRGRCKTVDILVKSRRRAGWQGTVLKSEGGAVTEFQSEMELFRCLGITEDSAD